MADQAPVFNQLLSPNNPLRRMLIISTILTSCIALASSVVLFLIQPEIPLFYSLPLSQDAVVSKWWILILPAISLFIALVHPMILWFSRDTEIMVLRLFAGFTLGVQLTLLAIVLRLILVIM